MSQCPPQHGDRGDHGDHHPGLVRRKTNIAAVLRALRESTPLLSAVYLVYLILTASLENHVPPALDLRGAAIICCIASTKKHARCHNGMRRHPFRHPPKLRASRAFLWETNQPGDEYPGQCRHAVSRRSECARTSSLFCWASFLSRTGRRSAKGGQSSPSSNPMKPSPQLLQLSCLVTQRAIPVSELAEG